MPYKSQSQRKRMHQLANEGKIDQKTVDEFDKASEGLKLPERLSKPKSPKKDLNWLKATTVKKIKPIK